MSNTQTQNASETNADAVEAAQKFLESLRVQATTGTYLERDDQVHFDRSKIKDLGIRVRILVERAIIRKLVKTVLERSDAQYSISVSDGEEWPVVRSRSLAAVMAEIGACDEERIAIRKGTTSDAERVGSVYLVYGNGGWDVLADNSVSDLMSELMKPAEDLADTLFDVMYT